MFDPIDINKHEIYSKKTFHFEKFQIMLPNWDCSDLIELQILLILAIY